MNTKVHNVILGACPVLILCITIPLAIYVPNQSDFNYNTLNLLPFLLAALLALGLFSALALSRKFHNSNSFLILFYIGVFFLLKDVISPIESKGLIGLDEKIIINEPFMHTIYEFIILISLVAGYKMIPIGVVKKAILPTVILFILINLGSMAMRIKWGPDVNMDPGSPNGVHSKAISPRNAPQKGNVYLICLDSFIGKGFLDTLSHAGISGVFEDFVYFKNNKTNYTFTWPSLASTLTGSIYEKGSMRNFVEKGRLHGGLLNDFQKNGYTLWMYGGEKHASVKSEYYRSMRAEDLSLLNKFYLFSSIYAVRIAPTFLKEDMFNMAIMSKFRARAALSSLIAGSLNTLMLLSQDESNRPAYNQFVYAHVYIPHAPYIYDKNCREVYLGDYLGQAACSLRPIVELLNQLKEADKFDSATVLIFSDHGTTGKGTENIEVDINGDFPALADIVGGRSPRHLALWSSALLLVKPPKKYSAVGNSDLTISGRLTQNGDIAATLEDLTGFPLDYDIGISVFDKDFPTEREINIYWGFDDSIYRKIKKFGMESENIEGRLVQLSYSLRSGLKYVSQIKCVW